jgi:hypothetical protein
MGNPQIYIDMKICSDIKVFVPDADEEEDVIL